MALGTVISKVRALWKQIAAGIAVIVGIFGFLGGDSDADMVENGYLDSCPEYTFGEMANAFLNNPKFESLVADDGYVYVNLTGGFTYDGKPVNGLVQFSVKVDDSFEYQAFEINGQPQNVLIANELLTKMCSAANEVAMAEKATASSTDVPKNADVSRTGQSEEIKSTQKKNSSQRANEFDKSKLDMFGQGLYTSITSAKDYDKAPAEPFLFSCEKPVGKVEKLICNDKDLLKIDNEMKRNYKIVANMLDDENSLKLAQESWMMTERNACDSKECLINTYAKRMEGLSMEMEGMYE